MSGKIRVASALACAVLLLAACGGQQATTDGGQETGQETTTGYATEDPAAEATTLSVDATEPSAGETSSVAYPPPSRADSSMFS